MSISDLQDAYKNKKYETKKVYPNVRFLNDNEVIDENKSVKWNREEVIRRNTEAKKAINEYRTNQNVLYKQLHDDAIEAVMHDFHFNHTQASKIESYVYEDNHSCMNDYFNALYDVSRFVNDIIKFQN